MLYRFEDHIEREGDVEGEGPVGDDGGDEVEGDHEQVLADGDDRALRAKPRLEHKSLRRDEEELRESDEDPTAGILSEKQTSALGRQVS